MWHLHKTSLALILMGITSVATSVQASDYMLDKVVSVTRHGVRPQTNTEKLDKGTGQSWPRFGVADGHLTGHGYTGMWQQGRYQLAQWEREGLSVHANLHAEASQRSTLITLGASIETHYAPQTQGYPKRSYIAPHEWPSML